MDYIQYMNEKNLISKYIQTGIQFSIVDRADVGELGYKMMMDVWSCYEKEYGKRGNKTIPLYTFRNMYRTGKGIDDFVVQRLEENQKPILYSEKYINDYLGKVKPKQNLTEILDDNKIIQFKTFILPSRKTI